ncbi:MAG: hypothetical protein LBT91_03310 [Bifidobacteriaceae bacterium]|jgi:hypothetical protein|nr:hypothetical protein [Bifidobacteriaceae bacterium]
MKFNLSNNLQAIYSKENLNNTNSNKGSKNIHRRIFFTIIGSVIIAILATITVISVPSKADLSYAAETPTGAGWNFDWTPHGFAGVQTWLGGFDLGAGRKGYCVEVGLAAGSPGDYPGSSGYYLNDSRLGYLVGAYGSSNDYLVQAALASAIHQLSDSGIYWPVIQANLPMDIKDKMNTLLDESQNKILNSSSLGAASGEYTAAKRLGNVIIPTTKNTKNGSLPKAYKASIAGPAVFKLNNSKTLAGINKGTNLVKLDWIAQGIGDITVKFDFEYEPVQVWKSEVPGLQPMIEIPDYKANHATKETKFLVSDKINPELATSTNTGGAKILPNYDTSRPDGGIYRAKGEAASDKITVWAKEGSWITDNNYNLIPVTLTGTLFGPYEESKDWRQIPDEEDQTKKVVTIDREIIPQDSAVLGDDIILRNSGIYTWQWSIILEKQPELYRNYFASGYDDGLFKNGEVIVAQMTGQFVSQISNRTADLGQDFFDTLSVWLPENDLWIEDQAVRFDGTLYGPYNEPNAFQQNMDLQDQSFVDQQSLVFTESGSKSSQTSAPLTPGFYTWNWIMPYNQSIKLNQIDLSDGFFQEPETISVLWEITHYSKMQEYNINSGGRVFDTVKISGMPENHTEFEGLENTQWSADLDEAQYTIYYYGQKPPATSAVPEDAMVFYEKTLPAQNGEYVIGKTDDDAIIPVHCGYYGAVYSFAGDDRVKPFSSPANDIDEQFYIDCGNSANFNSTNLTNITKTVQIFSKTEVPLLQTSGISLNRIALNNRPFFDFNNLFDFNNFPDFNNFLNYKFL